MYMSPKILAYDIVKEKNEQIRFFVETISNGDELCTLLGKCITQIKEECTAFILNIKIIFRGEDEGWNIKRLYFIV